MPAIINMHSCFKPEWHKNHPWLDGKACALFAPSDIRKQKLGTLVSKPFSLWTKQSSMFLSNQDSMTRMMDSCSAPTRTMLNKEARGANYSQYQGHFWSVSAFVKKASLVASVADEGRRNTHTHTQDNYSNPSCACAPRVNNRALHMTCVLNTQQNFPLP